MASIRVTTTPTNVATALGLTPASGSVAWFGQCQNRSRTRTVYRLRSATQPVPATAIGFGHNAGAIWPMTVHADEPTWLWTAEGAAHVVLEDGLPGV